MSAALPEYVTLAVDGYILMGWQEIDIERSAQHGAISFTLKATNPSWSTPAMALRRGRAVTIRTSPDLGAARSGGGDLLCIGAIDTYHAKIGSGANKDITITGRSKGRDAIDCPPVKHKTGKVKNKTLLDGAKEFDEEFGIGFSTDQQLDIVPLLQRHPHEPLFDTIEREARRQGLLLAAQPDGSIMLTRAGTKRHSGALVEAQSPVREWDINIAPHTKRSPVVVRGQKRLGTGKDSLRQEYQDEGDADVGYRPHLVIPEGDYTLKDLQKRAKWERLQAAGHGIQVTPCVSRWRDEDGLLWDPGRLMAIRVPSEMIDQDLTLSSARFSQRLGQDGGTTATLTFVDPKALGGKAGQGKSDPAFDSGTALE